MIKYSKILTLMTSTSLLSLGFMGGTAFAQSDTSIAEEDVIIVTGARGRVENEVEVPIAVTVFTTEEIVDAKIERVDDFIGLTPGVTIANSQDSGSNFITIRGVSQTRNGEPPVAVLIDGVLQVNARAFDQPLFDVDQIEVLKGPQGQLYGRNATQGAIIINTAGPTDEFEGYAQVTAATGGDYSVEGSVSGPISDNIGYRISGKYRDRDGQLDNVILDTPVDYLEETAVRGHLHWDVTDKLTADLRGSYLDFTGGSLNFTFQGLTIDPTTGFANGFGTPDADVVDRDFFANNLGRDDREVSQISLRLKYDLGFADLTSVSAYDTIEQFSRADQFPYTFGRTNGTVEVGDVPGFANFGIFFSNDGTQSQFVDVDAFSQEIRLTSTYDSPLRWVVGGYYVQTDRFISSAIGQDLGQGIAEVRRTPLVDNPFNPTTEFLADDNDNEAWALFANIDYAVTDRLELAFGARYDEDRREQTTSLDTILNVFDPNSGMFVQPSTPGQVDRETFSAFQPKITARYLLNDPSSNITSSVYASWGQGFRSGQFNQSGAAAAVANGAFAGAGDLIDQEDTETFEIGYKSNWGGRLDFNAALYDTQVTNAPYFVFVGEIGAQILVPIDEVSIQGGEAELSANIGDNLDVYMGVSVSDAEIEEYAINPALAGNDAPYVPNSTFNAGFQYRVPVTDNVGLFLRADYENRGRQFWDPENSTDRSSFELLGLRAGFEDNDGAWSLIGSISNATDEEYNSEFVAGGFAHAAPPRQYKVDLRYNF